jgi:hypothetical protein
MGSNNIFVREYLESLKEDTELDYLFPIMLNIMGFRIISTAKEAKGQSQYGKDIIAVGNDENGVKHKYYFELKGYDAKDITDGNYSVKDGVRESIIEARDTAFSDSSIPQFNSLPIKIVFVHNGIIKTNIRPTFDGFIQREFPSGGFERWDIYTLTDLFGQYLFSEYLLTDEESLRLFKRTLVLLDAPSYDYSDFKRLVDIQIEKVTEIKGRAFKKFFATLKLLSVIIHHYSKENNNLHPARECLTYLILKVWNWILKNKLEEKKAVTNEYRKLIAIHFEMLNEYFKKTIDVAKTEDGLYSERGGSFEEIGYPLRSFEYLNYLIYFFQVRKYWPKFNNPPSDIKDQNLSKIQKDCLFKILDNNDGCARPLLDNHSIAILNVFLYILNDKHLTQDDINFIGGDYLVRIFNNIMIIKVTRERFPELHSNATVLTEFASTKVKPYNYEDRSSLLITILFELVAFFNAETVYRDFKNGIKGKINLQTACGNWDEYNIEELMFEKHLYDEYYVEHDIQLPDTLEEFKATLEGKLEDKREYRTDKAGFPFLRTLAHVYYENEFFQDEWRSLFPKPEVNEPTLI